MRSPPVSEPHRAPSIYRAVIRVCFCPLKAASHLLDKASYGRSHLTFRGEVIRSPRAAGRRRGARPRPHAGLSVYLHSRGGLGRTRRSHLRVHLDLRVARMTNYCCRISRAKQGKNGKNMSHVIDLQVVNISQLNSSNIQLLTLRSEAPAWGTEPSGREGGRLPRGWAAGAGPTSPLCPPALPPAPSARAGPPGPSSEPRLRTHRAVANRFLNNRVH